MKKIIKITFASILLISSNLYAQKTVYWKIGNGNGSAGTSNSYTIHQIDSITAYLLSQIQSSSIASVFGRTGIITAQSSDYSAFYKPISYTPTYAALPDKPTIPTKTSQLTNDANFISNVSYSDLQGTVPIWNQNTLGTASALTTPRTITATSDLSWTVTFDGSSNVSSNAKVLGIGGVNLASLGTGLLKITVGTPSIATAADIPALDASKITSGVFNPAQIPIKSLGIGPGLETTITGDSIFLKPKVAILSSASTITINSDTCNSVSLLALASNTTFANPTGTPNDFQPLTIRIRDNGAPRTLSFGSEFRFTNTPAPSTTIANKIIYLLLEWNAVDGLWDVIN